MKDISFKNFLLADFPCDICGQDEDMCLGFTIMEETEDDYFETEIAICRDCVEALLDKQDELEDEYEDEIYEDEELTGC